METRRERRTTEAIPAQFQTGSLAGLGEIRTVSKLGMFVRTARVPSPGDPVTLSFDTPTGQTIEVVGHVRWTTQQLGHEPESPGFGMVIDEWNQEYQEWFERLLFA